MQERPQLGTLFENKAALSWLDAISQSNTILSAILAVIHPELHDAGQETINQLRQDTCHGRIGSLIFILSYLKTCDPGRILPYVEERHVRILIG